MSGLAMRYDMRNMDLPPRVLAEMAKADTTPLMEEIGEFVLSETLLNFDNEQTPEGEGWKPSLRATNEGGKTLQDTARLRDSYTYDARRDQVEIGSALIYAAIHHHGGTIKGKNGNLKFKVGDRWVQKAQVEIDARPALGVTGAMERDIGDMVLDFYRRIAA